MKRLVLGMLIFVFIGGTALAFEPLSFPPPINEGDVIIDVGVGLVHTGWAGNMLLPPLFAHVEYALPVGVPISLGGGLAFYRWGTTGTWSWTMNIIDIAARANWHFGFDISWLDFYAGVSLGYRIVIWDGWGTAVGTSGVSWSGQVGARFFFANNIGIVVETGFPYLLKAGLTLRF